MMQEATRQRDPGAVEVRGAEAVPAMGQGVDPAREDGPHFFGVSHVVTDEDGNPVPNRNGDVFLPQHGQAVGATQIPPGVTGQYREAMAAALSTAQPATSDATRTAMMDALASVIGEDTGCDPDRDDTPNPATNPFR